MAKFIVNKDGSRMLVSDDVPEDIEETGFSSSTKATTEAIPVVEPVNVLVYFTCGGLDAPFCCCGNNEDDLVEEGIPDFVKLELFCGKLGFLFFISMFIPLTISKGCCSCCCCSSLFGDTR